MTNLQINRNRVLLLVIIIIFIIIGATVYGFVTKKPSPNDTGGEPVSGLIDKDDLLLNNMTSNKFFTFQDRLIDYMNYRKVNPSTKIYIKSVKNYVRDGTKLDIIVDIPDLDEKNLEIKLNYTNNPYPKFSIPSKQYEVPFYGGQS